MGQITIRDQRTGRVVTLNVPGDRRVPTPDEVIAVREMLLGEPEQGATRTSVAPPSVSPKPPFADPLRQMVEPFRTVRGLDPAIRMAGGIVGTALGGGPTPTGVLGGGLGVAGASALIDPMVEMGRRTGIVGPEGPIIDDPQAAGGRGGALGIAQRAAGEGALDMALPAGLGAAARTGMRGFRAIASTAGPASLRIQQYAQELGIPLAIENVSERGALRKARETIGKFPFFNRPFTQLDVAQGEAIGRVQQDALDQIAPIVTTVTETGADLSRRATRRTRYMRKLFSRSYEEVLERATSEGALIPTTTVRQVARDIVDQFSGDLPRKTVHAGKGLQGVFGVTETAPISPEAAGMDTGIIDFARDELSNLTDTMTPRQFKRLQTILNDLIAANADSTTNAGRALALRRAIETDFEGIIGSDELVGELRSLNSAFKSWAKLLERPTAQRFERADRGVFSMAGMRPGSTNPDELYRVVFNQKSPQALGDLHRIVGTTGFRRALRLHMEEAFKSTFDETSKIADLSKVKASLGIGKPRSSERAAFAKALELSRTGQTIEQWERFFEVSEKALEQSPINVSQFIARRATLGGGRALIRGLNPASILAPTAAAGTGAYAGSLMGSTPAGLALGLMAAFGFRKGALETLTDPRKLKAATDAINPNLGLSARNQAFLRFSRLVGRENMRDIESAFDEAVTDFSRSRSMPAQEESRR